MENVTFAITFSTCFQLQFVVGNGKPSKKMFFAIDIYNLQLKTTIVNKYKWHLSFKCQPRVNTTTIATLGHFCYK